MRSFQPKKCKECGSEFIPRCGTQVYCPGPHTTVCECCGNTFTYTCSPREKPRYCSQECINSGKKNTVRKRYGVDNVSELQSVKDKISKANSSDEVRQKREQTCLDKYGVSNVSQATEIRDKLSNVMKTDAYLSGREKTCLERYGCSSPSQSDEVKEKRAQTCLDKYGTTSPPVTRQSISKRMIDPSKVDAFLEFKEDPNKYIQSHYQEKPTRSELCRDLGVTDTPIYDVLVQHGCSDVFQKDTSLMETEVISFLKTLKPDMQIIQRDRTIIRPQEIDIYLPEYKFGIECNPTITHNSSFIDPWDQPPKSYRYHQDKSFACMNEGVQLFHIFGYEWACRKDIIKSMISNRLGFTMRKLNARDTDICEISHEECAQFLDNNHRQGSLSARIRLGLRLTSTGELVSVMTFGRIRQTIGSTIAYTTNIFELSRFCSLVNTSVRGGAEKLFKHFINNYCADEIVSFSDVAHTSGKLYGLLGFSKMHTSSPGYVWVNVSDDFPLNRLQCQKRHLKKLFSDNSIDVDAKTERQIMEEHGYAQVYDSGTIRWVWSRTGRVTLPERATKTTMRSGVKYKF